MAELKSCPFCGGTPELMDTLPSGSYWYRCEECGGETEGGKKHAEAVAAWNRRAAPTLPADVKQFGAGEDWDAAAHINFLCRVGGAQSGYTADLLEKLFAALTAQSALLDRAREVIKPFADVLAEYDPEDEDNNTPGTLVIGSVTNYDLTLEDLRAASRLHHEMEQADA